MFKSDNIKLKQLPPLPNLLLLELLLQVEPQPEEVEQQPVEQLREAQRQEQLQEVLQLQPLELVLQEQPQLDPLQHHQAHLMIRSFFWD